MKSLAICNPQRIVALSVLVDDPQYSNVTELAHHVTGRTNAGAEQILHFHPDMIFVASYSKAELELLHMAHAPVFRFAHFDHLDDIKMNIRTIGYIIGEDDKAEALVQHAGARYGAARASIPHDAPSLRVMLAWTKGLYRGRTRRSMTWYRRLARPVSPPHTASRVFGKSAANNSSSES